MILAVSESDGFAIAMLIILCISMAFVGLILFGILRHGKRRNREVEDLLEETSESQRPREKAGTPDKPKSEPWERESDWWKEK